MPDIFLYSGEANPNDIKLRDPTVLAGAGAINATFAVTIDNVTQSAEADLLIQATAAQTIEAVTLSTNADLLVQATAAQTIDAVTLASAADLLVQATAAQTLDNVTLTASATLEAVATTRRGDDGGWFHNSGEAKRAIYKQFMAELAHDKRLPPLKKLAKRKAKKVVEQFKLAVSDEGSFQPTHSSADHVLSEYLSDGIDYAAFAEALQNLAEQHEARAIRKRKHRSIALMMLMAA